MSYAPNRVPIGLAVREKIMFGQENKLTTKGIPAKTILVCWVITVPPSYLVLVVLHGLNSTQSTAMVIAYAVQVHTAAVFA